MDGEHALSFAGLKLPKLWDEHELTEKQRAEQGVYRILCGSSDGNPSIVLRFLRQSRHQGKAVLQSL
jgi:hypothetical protein